MTQITEQFEEAIKASKQISNKPSNDTLLQLYSLYKQATEGDLNAEPPGAFDFVAQAKFNAWSAQKGKTKEDAMKAYVELVNKLKS